MKLSGKLHYQDINYEVFLTNDKYTQGFIF